MSSEIEEVDESKPPQLQPGDISAGVDVGAGGGTTEKEALKYDVYPAAAYGDLEKLQRLVEGEGQSVVEPDGLGHLALQWAALNNRTDAAQYIIKHGGDVNAVDHKGQTALHWSAVWGHIQVAELLLKEGAKIDAADLYGYQTTHIAAQNGQAAYLYHVVVKWNADPDVLDNHGRSPLHWAAYKGFRDCIRLLLFLDANWTRQDKEGCTPLHLAAIRGNLEACTDLAQAGKILQQNKEEIGELKKILQRVKQEKEQLTRENEHEKLQSEQVKKNLEKNLKRNDEQIRELKEILQRERQEKEQLTREIKENEHEKLQSEQDKEILTRNLQRNEEEIGELKETLQRERQEKNQLSQKIEENELDKVQSKQVKIDNDLLRSQIDEYINQIQVENERRLALEKQVSGSELVIKDLRVKLASDGDRIVSLQADLYNMQQKRDNLVRLVKELCTQIQKMPFSSSTALKEFSLQELQQATQYFSESLKIGEGGFGPVYKGYLRQITVAIKMLHSQSRQGVSQFEQEITILTKMRHRNLVTLIGTCSELSALVYEYLPNGSLEDRLTCANNTPPLTWQARTRIIGEICLALIFLHSNKPELVIHGDLKPENILLDTNFMSKLSDFGISHLLIQPDTDTTAFFEASHILGTHFYIDPEVFQTAKLTPKSDIYSFGIIILRLLIGKPPKNIVSEVQDAMRDGILLSVIDKSAGTWPFEQAKELAETALRCAKPTGSERPNLVNEVWAVVEPLMKAATCVDSIASHFICPTIQEVMQDPCIAADTFASGHGTISIEQLGTSHIAI